MAAYRHPLPYAFAKAHREDAIVRRAVICRTEAARTRIDGAEHVGIDALAGLR